jgi:hypothetical protein
MMSPRTLRFGLLSGLVLASVAAGATPPSAGCKEGAEHCKEAFLALEKCQKEKSATPEACVSERTSTDQACKGTTSICHNDGSRRRPR